MSGLEQVKAPANFLANVRARLPQPSPWKRALMGLTRPWRAIPLQIAVLTVLGITVITAYLYQNGGVVSETSRAPVAGYEAIPPAPSPKPAVPAPAPEALRNADAESEVPSEEPAPTAKTQALRKELRPAKKSLRSSGGAQPEAFAEDARPAPVPAPAPRTVSRPVPAVTASRRAPASRTRAEAPAADAPAAEAPVPAEPPAVDRLSGGNRAVSSQAKASAAEPQTSKPKPSDPKSSAPGKSAPDVEVTGWLDNPSAVYILGRSDEEENLGAIASHGDGSQRGRLAAGGNRDAVEPEKKKAKADQNAMKDAAPASAPASATASVEGKAGSAPAGKGIPETVMMSEDGYGDGDAKAESADTAPAFLLRMRTAKDTAAVLAGLKAMGAEVVSPPRERDPEYVLRLPPSAFGEIGPYLERYGKVERRGRLSSAHLETPAHVRLRMILPGK
jgi:hypothetical protein